jgi:predicted transcriptional regulator
MTSDVLELETRRSIFDIVQDNPGLHMREIARRCELKLSLVEYHIRTLVNNDLLVSVKEDGYRRFYISGDVKNGRIGLSLKQKRMLHVLRQVVPLNVIAILLEKRMCQHKEILGELDISASTLSYHLSKMRGVGIVEKVRTPNDKGFKLVKAGEVLWLLMMGKIEIPTVVDGFITTWDEFY